MVFNVFPLHPPSPSSSPPPSSCCIEPRGSPGDHMRPRVARRTEFLPTCPWECCPSRAHKCIFSRFSSQSGSPPRLRVLLGLKGENWRLGRSCWVFERQMDFKWALAASAYPWAPHPRLNSTAAAGGTNAFGDGGSEERREDAKF